MRRRPAQVAEQLGVGAAGFFEGVGVELKARELAGIGNSRSEAAHDAAVPFSDGPIESDGAEK
jgi:hypothetical protein